MKYSESEKALRSCLKSKKLLLRSLTADALLNTSVELWVNNDFEDALTVRGDGLLAYFTLMHRPNGTVFEFGINRLFRLSEFNPDSAGIENLRAREAAGLSLRLGIRPTADTFNINPLPWSVECWDKSESNRFVEEVRTNLRFQHVLSTSSLGASISYFTCKSPARFSIQAGDDFHWGIV